MCDFKTEYWKCPQEARYGIKTFGREDSIKYFCRAHFDTVKWTLVKSGERFEVITGV